MLVVPGRNATHVEPAVSSMKPSSMQWTPVRRCSFAVIRYGVDAEAGDFAIAHFELLLHAGQVTQFRSADGSEVFRMREKHPPGIANELVEADAALSGFGLEIGRRVIDSQCRGAERRTPKSSPP